MKFRTKIAILIVVSLACFAVDHYFFSATQPTLMTDLALEQMTDSDSAAETLRFADTSLNYVFGGIVLLTALVLFWNNFWQLVDRGLQSLKSLI